MLAPSLSHRMKIPLMAVNESAEAQGAANGEYAQHKDDQISSSQFLQGIGLESGEFIRQFIMLSVHDVS